VLTKAFVDHVKPEPRSRRFTDGRGMYLEVAPAGGRWWRLKYRLSGKERRMSLGIYPDVPLAKARERREAARQLIADGIDPIQERRDRKAKIIENSVNTFQSIAREWHSQFSPKWVPEHRARIIRCLEADIFPWVGARPTRAITPQELLVVLRRIEARGAKSIAPRALQICGRIFRLAVATGRADRDPTRDLIGALEPYKVRHFASLSEPDAVGDLMRAIQDYRGAFVTRCALRLAPLVFVRPGELRQAQWSEFDFAKSHGVSPPSA